MLRSFNTTLPRCVLRFDSDDCADWSIKTTVTGVPEVVGVTLAQLIKAMRPNLRVGLTGAYADSDVEYKVCQLTSNKFGFEFKTIKPLPLSGLLSFCPALEKETMKAARAFFTKRAVDAARPVAAPPADCDDPCGPD
jgi:hypothetical protein